MNQRPVCPQCEFIEARCLCPSLKDPIANNIDLIILQHPSETKHALNTVRILKKSFRQITVFIGENFNDHVELKKIIQEHHPALIFPKANSPLLESVHRDSITHLILLDGTWKKAKKIFLTSTLLQTLPCFSLNPTKESEYKIRSSKIQMSLSTLEATLNALAILDPQLETQHIQRAFLAMIDFQIEKMGSETFLKNYHSPNKDKIKL